MDSLLSGPFATFMIVVALAVFAGLFWDLMDDMREDGGSGRDFRRFWRRPRPFWRRPPPRGSARTSRGFRQGGRPPPPPPGGRESLQFSRTVETWIDSETGETRGHVIRGDYRGRGLETLSRADCLRLNEYCLRADPEAARLLAAYLTGRFGDGPRAQPGGDQSRRRAAVDGAMTREDAYAVLGLAEAADESQIVKAHRALIKKHHPDHGGSTADAARINQAKDTLLAKSG